MEWNSFLEIAYKTGKTMLFNRVTKCYDVYRYDKKARKIKCTDHQDVEGISEPVNYPRLVIPSCIQGKSRSVLAKRNGRADKRLMEIAIGMHVIKHKTKIMLSTLYAELGITNSRMNTYLVDTSFILSDEKIEKLWREFNVLKEKHLGKRSNDNG